MDKSNYYRLEDISGTNGKKPYEEVSLLQNRDIINPQRGRYNRILLCKRDKQVLESFLEFKESYDSLPLAVSEFKKKQVKSKLESVEDDKKKLREENKRLKNKLVTVRKPFGKRLLVRFRDWLDQLI